MPIIPEMPIIPTREMDGSDRSEERLRGFGRKRRFSEEGREGF